MFLYNQKHLGYYFYSFLKQLRKKNLHLLDFHECLDFNTLQKIYENFVKYFTNARKGINMQNINN